jgi:hypothetical protein
MEATLREKVNDEAEHAAFKKTVARHRAHVLHIRLVAAGSNRPRFGSSAE